MSNIKDKIIREDDAIATIKFKEGISEGKTNLIDSIISKNYDQECDFIIKIDRNTYKGDMGCLCVLGINVCEELQNNNLWNFITCYNLYNKRTNEYVNYLED